MGISKYFTQWFKRYWKPVVELDIRLLDGWIHDALSEEASALPPAGAWDRLYNAIREREPVKVKSYGMWILDEPFRDPPVSPLGLLYHSDSQRLDDNPQFSRSRNDLHEILWSHLPPSFIAVAAW